MEQRSRLAVTRRISSFVNPGAQRISDKEGLPIGVITDRDICIALGTRNRVAGDVTVSEVMPGKLYSCAPDDEIHMASQTMKEGKVRRLPVIAKNGPLVGVVSMDDILLRAEPARMGKEPELSTDEVVRTYRAITQGQVPQVAARQATAA